jgi:hypothetical protein
MMSPLSSLAKRQPPCVAWGCSRRCWPAHTEDYSEGVDDDDEPDEDGNRTGQEGT